MSNINKFFYLVSAFITIGIVLAFTLYKPDEDLETSSSKQVANEVVEQNPELGNVLTKKERTPPFFDSSVLTSSDIVIKITDDGFVPEALNIKKGEKVNFVNNTSGHAWPASDPHPNHTAYPIFDAQLPMKKGQVWSFVFNDIGEFKFHDNFDPTKRGIVYVAD